jgi:uncharacterized protein YndB with AHSA1/START domain
MDTVTSTALYERTIAIDASPETVWEFFVDPQKLVRWMGIDAELDPQHGGIYRCDVIPGHTARGEYVEVDKPHRVVFTWGWEAGPNGEENAVPPGTSTVEIELIPNGEGTTLRFNHYGLPGAEAAQSHGHGWDHYLARLVTAAGGGDPGADPWLTGEMG